MLGNFVFIVLVPGRHHPIKVSKSNTGSSPGSRFCASWPKSKARLPPLPSHCEEEARGASKGSRRRVKSQRKESETERRQRRHRRCRRQLRRRRCQCPLQSQSREKSLSLKVSPIHQKLRAGINEKSAATARNLRNLEIPSTSRSTDSVTLSRRHL